MYNENVASTIYKIEGPSREDIVDRLWKKYGSNYQIVSSKTILKGGFLGFGQKEVLEISYRLLNENNESKSSGIENNIQNEKKLSLTDAQAFMAAKNAILKNSDPQVASNVQVKQMMTKLKEDLIGEIEKLKNSNLNEEHLTIREIQKKLKLNEFTDSYISMITEKIRKEFSIEELDDFNKVQAQVVDWIGESINVAKPKTSRSPHVIVIVGPTGVGKTTTIAKMSANIIIKARDSGLPLPSVKLITIDTMRVGAEAQLKNYGEIMQISVDRAETADDVKALFNDYKARLDYLLIDTSGYSPNDFENIGKMRGVLEVPGLKPDVYLAITAGSKPNDIERILNNYEQFGYNSVIITKFDETTSFGNIISVLSEKNKSISWITDGQQVPHFIERANPIKFLINLQDFTVDRKHIEEKFNNTQED